MRLRGRARFALALLGFLLVATGVIWRRSVGIAAAREVRVLEERRSTLQARSTKLENDIREATSLSRLAPIVERRLQMSVPSASQVVILPKHTSAP
ncbi:MAG TPA: hypothetical protein VMM18_09155 [Gemmatimonadaceae bacterium]|nr:hypothetical protein [Gemmatimonadaceae bacterium]